MSRPDKQLIENVQLIINDTKPEYQAEEVSQYIIDLINKARIETVEELREELNFIKGDYGYEEIKDFLATLKSKQKGER